jgi:hypothetical protein
VTDQVRNPNYNYALIVTRLYSADSYVDTASYPPPPAGTVTNSDFFNPMFKRGGDANNLLLHTPILAQTRRGGKRLSSNSEFGLTTDDTDTVSVNYPDNFRFEIGIFTLRLWSPSPKGEFLCGLWLNSEFLYFITCPLLIFIFCFSSRENTGSLCIGEYRFFYILNSRNH